MELTINSATHGLGLLIFSRLEKGDELLAVSFLLFLEAFPSPLEEERRCLVQGLDGVITFCLI